MSSGSDSSDQSHQSLANSVFPKSIFTNNTPIQSSPGDASPIDATQSNQLIPPHPPRISPSAGSKGESPMAKSPHLKPNFNLSAPLQSISSPPLDASWDKQKPVSDDVPQDLSTEIDPIKTTGRSHPISPPSEPMQYRAIGLIRGRYIPSEEMLTRGTLLALDGTQLDSVVLGRVISLFKKHLDLTLDHLWVVYPRTREDSQHLHVQIAGVWNPEKLHPSHPNEADPPFIPVSVDQLKDGYFSIRGEIVFQSPETHRVVVKIKQTSRKKDHSDNLFKLELFGEVLPQALQRFWEFQVMRHGHKLMIQDGRCVGVIPPRKRGDSPSDKLSPRSGSKKISEEGHRNLGNGLGSDPTHGVDQRKPMAKPIKKVK